MTGENPTGNTISPFARPLYALVKPFGAACNLRCQYCYYLEKAELYPDRARHAMSDETLELFVKQYIEGQTTREVLFTWHGGEPLLGPIEFYERALELQRHYGRGRTIVNSLQTNGTLLDDAWCDFFAKNGFLVGVSIDGTEPMHDVFRRTAGGGPSHAHVMRGIELLNKHGVQWNAMAVVNSLNAECPEEFYAFFKSIGCRYIQFTPIVETQGPAADISVSPEQWGRFLNRLFDVWVTQDVGHYFIQTFDATLSNWMGLQPGVCSLSSSCGHALAVEWNGDVYACDHFVFPEHKIGNIHDETLTAMAYGAEQSIFARQKTHGLPRQCKECKWLFACHGECPKNRFCTTADGEPGLNYLCSGYKSFFEHSALAFDAMRKELEPQG